MYLIDTQITFVEQQLISGQSSPKVFTKILQWKGSAIEIVELVYALHEAGCFGKAALKTVFTIICKTFGCEITNYYRLFWDIRNRTAEDRTYFLNKLRQTLSGKLIRMDRGAKS